MHKYADIDSNIRKLEAPKAGEGEKMVLVSSGSLKYRAI
jgi:hypothetical protein